MSLGRWIERHAAFTPDKAAIHFENQALSYADLAERVRRLAAGLRQGLAIRHGDRVAWLGLNHPDCLVLLIACARLGAILVPLNWRLAPAEHRAILADAEPKALFCQAALREQIEDIRADFPECNLIGSDFADARWAAFGDLLQADALAEALEGNPEDAVLIVYTSGTTGQPKGAVLTQDALLWNAVNSAHMHDLTSADHVLTVLPLFHVGGLNIQTLPALHAGASVTLHRRFEAGATLEAIALARPTLTVLVPATMRALIDHPAWRQTDLTSLRLVATGSQIVPAELIDGFHARGVPVAQVYGTTETAPVAVYQRREDARRSPGSTGKPALHCDLRIIGEGGSEVPAGERGEVLIRGPNLMSHYWRNSEATSAALRDGWFHTGDIGHLDQQGDLWIDARKDDLIKSGGERIYPAELEDLLRQAPGVAEVAIVGRPDPTWGEVPVAMVVAAGENRPTIGDLNRCLEGRVARFKHAKDVLFVDELPKSALGKVLRYRLRAMVRSCDG
ncbi:MAG TPA: AMP-binding protein [Geminicoccaceae bacterium]|nr:AMP-binding protein [Geminicoccaceae bacterium]